ncbi:hypothetical protein NUH87_30905 [Pseudomonas batumici]|uniref:hypothetical protein n=1 Tax=Pseudomonas batumici TaxID=226910 RepID=UPI0030D5E1D5
MALLWGGTDNDKIYIASRWVDYQDFGDWMIKETSADKLEMQFSEFTTENIAAFKENAAAASALTLELAVLREQHRDPSRQPWWEEKGGNPNLDLIEKYRPLAEELDKVMQKQFFLLPEVLQKEIQEHLVISQLLGDWDPINPFYKNMGVVEDEWGELHIMRLDFGSCLDVGFRGQAKEHGYHMAVNQRPAVFPELKHIFKEENAPFSEVLPKLGEAFDNLPYADYAKSISGNPEWAEFTRLKIAYRCVLLRQADKNIIADIIRRNLIDEPGSIAGLKTKESLIDVMNARIEALILQCGGLEKIDEFERNHQDVANSIRESVLSALQDHGQSFG